jgi:hypothetical protein
MACALPTSVLKSGDAAAIAVPKGATVEVTIPLPRPDSRAWLQITADANSIVHESNESNNMFGANPCGIR